MRRALIDLGTVCCLVSIGIVLYQLSSSGVPLGVAARFENVIWTGAVTIVAIFRAYIERILYLPPFRWLQLVHWIVIATGVHLILFWLDTVVILQDKFVTVFAFGLWIFLLPSVLISAIAYLLTVMVLGKSRRASTG